MLYNVESSADKTRLVDPFFLPSPGMKPIEYYFQLKERARKFKRAKECHRKKAVQWEYSWPSLGALAAVALIVPVPSMNCEWDSSTMKRISDFQPSKRARCVYFMAIFSCTTLQSACYASLFLFQVKNDPRRKLKREHTAACLRITVKGPAHEAYPHTHTHASDVFFFYLFIFVLLLLFFLLIKAKKMKRSSCGNRDMTKGLKTLD